MKSDFQTMIAENEAGIVILGKRIQKIQDSIPSLSGESLAIAYRKIKIYDSMIDDLIYTQAKMKAYVN